jgi:hypothetical protein
VQEVRVDHESHEPVRVSGIDRAEPQPQAQTQHAQHVPKHLPGVETCEWLTEINAKKKASPCGGGTRQAKAPCPLVKVEKMPKTKTTTIGGERHPCTDCR